MIYLSEEQTRSVIEALEALLEHKANASDWMYTTVGIDENNRGDIIVKPTPRTILIGE